MMGSLLVVMLAQQKHSDQLLQQASIEIDTRRTKNKALKKQCEEIKESLTKANEALNKSDESLKQTKETLDKADGHISQVESQLKAQEDEYAKLQDEHADLKQVLSAQGAELDKTEYELTVTTQRADHISRELESATEQIEDLKLKLQVWEKARENENQFRHDANRELRETREQLHDLQLDKREKERELDKVKRELEHSLEYNSFSKAPARAHASEEAKGNRYDRGAQLDLSLGAMSPIDPGARTRTDRDLGDRGKRSSSPQPLSVSRVHHSRAPSDRDLDKIARNITRYEPKAGGKNDTKAYLEDIKFYLGRFPDATVDDRLYLIRGTSSQKVNKFIDRQTPRVKNNYEVLSKALIDEFKSYTIKTGLTAALTVKQGRQESPQEYYERLHEAYFGPKNETEMEEELHFKSLFVQNLHPSTSHHLGVMACPETLTSRQLREMATKGFNKQRQALVKTPETNILSVSSKGPPLELEGAPNAEPPESAATSSKFPKPPIDRGYSRSDSDQRHPQKPRFAGYDHPRGGSNYRFSDSRDTRRPFNQWKGNRSYNNREPDRREPRNYGFNETRHQNPSDRKEIGKSGHVNSRPDRSGINKEDVDAIRRVIE
uniref:Uncharacterized protein n=1 Tax=Sparus aurata TaxID=8175 RepID=A0A671WJS1_SPAAU